MFKIHYNLCGNNNWSFFCFAFFFFSPKLTRFTFWPNKRKHRIVVVLQGVSLRKFVLISLDIISSSVAFIYLSWILKIDQTNDQILSCPNAHSETTIYTSLTHLQTYPHTPQPPPPCPHPHTQWLLWKHVFVSVLFVWLLLLLFSKLSQSNPLSLYT